VVILASEAAEATLGSSATLSWLLQANKKAAAQKAVASLFILKMFKERIY
jgi:hypothetical protein